MLPKAKSFLRGHLGIINASLFVTDHNFFTSDEEEESELAAMGKKNRIHEGVVRNYNQVVTGGKDCCLKLWDLNYGYCTWTTHAASPINDIVLVPTKGILCSGHKDGVIRLWDSRIRRSVKEILMENIGSRTRKAGANKKLLKVSNLSSSFKRGYTGQELLVSSHDDTACWFEIVDIWRGQVIKKFNVKTEPNSFTETKRGGHGAVSPDGRFIVAAAAASGEKGLFVWDVEESTQAILHTSTMKDQWEVVRAAWKPASTNTVVAGTKEGHVVFWGNELEDKGKKD